MQRGSLPTYRWMRQAGLAVMACVCAGMQSQLPALSQPRTEEPRSFILEKPLLPGGRLDFVVNGGDVHIVRNLHPAQIRLEVRVMTPLLDPLQAQQRWVKRMDVDGSHASIDLQLPMSRSAGLVTLFVPPAISLVVRLHSGRLTVAGVKGDKDLRLGTGTLTLREPDPSQYQHVRADVRVGELTDGVFHGKPTGLLRRQLVAEGKGQYQLLLHVGSGDLVLTGEDGGL